MGGFQNFAISFTIISILAGCLTSYCRLRPGRPDRDHVGWPSSARSASSSRSPWARSRLLSDRGRPLLLGVQAWSPAGAGSQAGSTSSGRSPSPRDRLRVRDVHHLALEPALRLQLDELGAVHLRRSSSPSRASSTCSGRGDGDVEHDLRVVAHDRRARRRRRADRRLTNRSFGYVWRDAEQHRLLGHEPADFVFIYVFVTGLLMAQYTITGFDASARRRGDASGVARAAWGMVMSVVVSVIFRFILLTAVTFALPNASNETSSVGIGRSDVRVTEAMNEAGRVRPLHRRRRTALLRRRQSRLRRDDVRVLARPRRAGRRVWRKLSRGERVPVNCVIAICILSFRVDDPDVVERVRGLCRGHQVAVIGLYIAFVLPIILRLRAGESFERGAWHLGKHYKWIDWLAIIWIAFISIAFMLPFAIRASRGTTASRGTSSTTPILVFGAILLRRLVPPVGAQVVQGPVRQGDEEELERIEAEYERREKASSLSGCRILTSSGRGPLGPRPLPPHDDRARRDSRAASGAASSRTPSGSRLRSASGRSGTSRSGGSSRG